MLDNDSFLDAEQLIEGVLVHTYKHMYTHRSVYTSCLAHTHHISFQNAHTPKTHTPVKAHITSKCTCSPNAHTCQTTESNDIDLDPEATPLAVIPVQRPSMLLAFESYGRLYCGGCFGCMCVLGVYVCWVYVCWVDVQYSIALDDMLL